MESFNELNISKQLQYAIADLGFEKPTPIQAQSF
jgi:ATP-dependent RNA helicase RhlE